MRVLLAAVGGTVVVALPDRHRARLGHGDLGGATGVAASDVAASVGVGGRAAHAGSARGDTVRAHAEVAVLGAEALVVRTGVIVDATVGAGGHDLDGRLSGRGQGRVLGGRHRGRGVGVKSDDRVGGETSDGAVVGVDTLEVGVGVGVGIGGLGGDVRGRGARGPGAEVAPGRLESQESQRRRNARRLS